MPFRFAPCALALFATSMFAAHARAQCTDVWLPGWGTPGVFTGVNDAVLWDPDGAGLQPELVVLAATGNVAGDGVFRQFATWDPTTGAWGSLDAAVGEGGNTCLLVRANGELIAGGMHPNGAIVSRRTPSGWQQIGGLLGSWFGDEVWSLVELPNGHLVAAGRFSTSGNIARWDGAQWLPMAGGLTGLPRELVVSATGELYLCGDFAPAQVVRWDGSQWQPVGGDLGSVPSRILFDATGGLVATGRFPLSGGGATGVLRWDGGSWSTTGLPKERARFASKQPNGELIVEATGYPTEWYRWDGVTWSLLVSIEYASLNAALTLPNGELFVAGVFREVGGVVASSAAAFDGVAWRALADGFDERALALVEGPTGDLIAAGRFRSTPNGPASYVARFDGTTWSPLGAGLDDVAYAAAIDANGDLVVGGEFGQAGGVAANRVARWDGANWSPLGGGLDDTVRGLVVLPTGDLLAGVESAQGVMRWNGSSWSPLGTPPSFTYALAQLPNGDVVAGSFLGASRWDGASWTPLTFANGQPIFGDVVAMLPMPDGSLLLGGVSFFSPTAPPSGLLRWDGTHGETVAPALYDVTCLARAGDQVFAGRGSSVVRWDGATWHDVGIDYGAAYSALLVRSDGELVISGSFGAVDGAPSAYLARKVPTCPPRTFAAGSGCAGTSGTPALVVEGSPWIGERLGTRTKNLPIDALAVVVHGFGPQQIPLAPLLPQAGAACTLWTTTDVLDLAIATGGEVAYTAWLPSDRSLAGAFLFEQVVALELDASSAIVDVVASDAVALQLGIFAD